MGFGVPVDGRHLHRMDTVRAVEVIEVRMRMRMGTGVASDPVREVVQYWSMEGDLLAEHDPCASGGELADGAREARPPSWPYPPQPASIPRPYTPAVPGEVPCSEHRWYPGQARCDNVTVTDRDSGHHACSSPPLD